MTTHKRIEVRPGQKLDLDLTYDPEVCPDTWLMEGGTARLHSIIFNGLKMEEAKRLAERFTEMLKNTGLPMEKNMRIVLSPSEAGVTLILDFLPARGALNS
jgi:hypothetical protein